MDVKLEYDTLKTLILSYLKSDRRIRSLDINAVEIGIFNIAKEKGIITEDINYDIGVKFDANTKDVVRTIIWEFIVSGILTPGGSAQSNYHRTPDGLPSFYITDYGCKCLKNENVSPYDPAGYMQWLRREVVHVDDDVLFYVTESLATFRFNCFSSSSVMLGCASERTLLLLIDSFTNAISDVNEKESFQKKMLKELTIKKKFDVFKKKLEQRIGDGKISKDVSDGIDVTLNGVFELIRNFRNDAGHPKGKRIEKVEALTSLLLFPHYYKKSSSLIEWLSNNTI
ncbi:MAG: hypothetical protein HZC51_07425 [Nitrospirae bacterium]|nr:hypothetical protein [Nitrospirota bacterium]